MAEINWMEFHEWVPQKITTVLLPTGTLEAHGVENNGADITAPVEIARRMAARVNAMIAPVVPPKELPREPFNSAGYAAGFSSMGISL